MTDEEIKNKAKETSGGNYYYEQGFIYGFELGEENCRKELEQWKQEWQDAQIKANEEGFARTTLQIKYTELEEENKVLKQIIMDLLSRSDGCECCIAKGQHAPACECMHDAECVEHMIKLYREKK